MIRRPTSTATSETALVRDRGLHFATTATARAPDRHTEQTETPAVRSGVTRMTTTARAHQTRSATRYTKIDLRAATAPTTTTETRTARRSRAAGLPITTTTTMIDVDDAVETDATPTATATATRADHHIVQPQATALGREADRDRPALPTHGVSPDIRGAAARLSLNASQPHKLHVMMLIPVGHRLEQSIQRRHLKTSPRQGP